LGISFDAPAAPARKWKSKIWDDDEERLFYEVVLDLQSQLPPSLLTTQKKKQKDKEQPADLESERLDDDDDGEDEETTKADAGAVSEANIEDINEDDINVDLQTGAMDGDDDAGVDEAASSAGLIEYQKFLEQRQRGTGAGDGQDVKSDLETVLPATEPESQESSPGNSADAKEAPTVVQKSVSSGETVHSFVPVKFHELLSQLPAMTSKERVDQLAVNFCYVNGKGNRAKLVRTLADAPRRQLFLLPYYARLMATLHPYFPEIGDGVVEELAQEFRWLSRQKSRDLLELRLRNIRYIAELTKFKVAPLHVAIRCSKSLLEQFHAQNIEILCSLLDSCGRFLLAQPETAGR
ncbi:mRNA decay protein, partial [Linderina macrospora]